MGESEADRFYFFLIISIVSIFVQRFFPSVFQPNNINASTKFYAYASIFWWLLYCRAKALYSPENDLDIHFIGSFIRYTNPSERKRISSHNYGAAIELSQQWCHVIVVIINVITVFSLFRFPELVKVNHLLGKFNIYIHCMLFA